MFVLSNAWRALTRSKGRTALTAFITLAVTFGTVAGLAIIQEDTNAHTCLLYTSPSPRDTR